MKTTKAFRLQEVRQSHTARVYGRDKLFAGLLDASTDSRGERFPFGNELGIGPACFDAVLRADDPVVVTLELSSRMSGAMLEERLALLC